MWHYTRPPNRLTALPYLLPNLDCPLVENNKTVGILGGAADYREWLVDLRLEGVDKLLHRRRRGNVADEGDCVHAVAEEVVLCGELSLALLACSRHHQQVHPWACVVMSEKEEEKYVMKMTDPNKE